MGEWIAFAALAAALLFTTRQVVVSRDLVHSVYWLAATLVATAALYVSLHADFVAAAQIILYTGGIITLMLFGVMLTRRLTGARMVHESRHRLRGGLLAAAIFLLVAGAVLRSGARGARAPALQADTRALGSLFLTDLLLPFEILSVLLLAAMIGAIVLARKSDP